MLEWQQQNIKQYSDESFIDLSKMLNTTFNRQTQMLANFPDEKQYCLTYDINYFELQRVKKVKTW